MAARMREIAERTKEPLVQQSACLMVGTAQLYRGELDAAVRELDRAASSGNDEGVYTYGFALESLSCCFSALACHLNGRTEDALTRVHRGVDLARQVGDPNTLSTALHFAAVVHRWRREVEMATPVLAGSTIGRGASPVRGQGAGSRTYGAPVRAASATTFSASDSLCSASGAKNSSGMDFL